MNDVFCRSFSYICSQQELEHAVPGYTPDPASELFLRPDHTFVNAMVDSTAIVLARASEIDPETNKLSPLLSAKVLMLKTSGVEARVVHFAEWRKEFESSAERGDKYIADRVDGGC